MTRAIPSERALILSATRQLATDLFAAGKRWRAASALSRLACCSTAAPSAGKTCGLLLNFRGS